MIRNKKKPLLIILDNGIPDDINFWIKSCNNLENIIDYKIVNILSEEWISDIQQNQSIQCFLTKPPGISSIKKQFYDERLMILNESFGQPIFPTLQEVLIYENKRYFASWLKANKIPHPKTFVFLSRNEAESFAVQTQYPIVAKVSIGASGSGVTILHSEFETKRYIKDTFEGKGAKRRSGPNLKKGGLVKRFIHYIFHPADIKKKLNIYHTVRNDKQTTFVIFQEYIPHSFEWRVVRIGDSFFAHKKIKQKDKASGTLLKSYENPPLDLLTFVKDITDKHRFYSQAIDIFESKRGFLVNEMQCFFGQSDPYQMMVDGNPGKYVYENADWIFQEGDFTTNHCYDLRMQHVLNMYK